MIDIPTGSTGFTIDVFDGSASDSEGAVTKALFAITFQERLNDIKFSISKEVGHWSALMPTGEYIGLSNPKVLFENRDSAIVIFDMEEKYPSNTNVILAMRDTNAKYTVTEISGDPKPFVENTIIGSVGFTSNEYGGSTDDEGCVKRMVFNISFSNRLNEIEFDISEDPNDWAALMGDGTYINLINPNVLFQNRDGATIVFQMESSYPSNAPGILVRRREEANYTITEIDEDHPFVPIQNIVFPSYLPAGERINLHAQSVIYPMNSTMRGTEWSIRDAGETGAVVSGGWIETTGSGTITLHATVPNGLGIGQSYQQDIQVMIIDNWIEIKEHPHLETAPICGEIDELISVIATTPSGDLTYQWYRANNMDNSYGNAIAGAESSIYALPKGLVPGDYYYFCEVRKTNFPSIRTNVAKVRIRDRLTSISIFPPSASIPPGQQKQFGIDRNPETSDELLPVRWFSSDHSIITVDDNGLATAFNPGSVILTAQVGEVQKTISVNAIYVAATGIVFDMPLVIEAGVEYNLPTGVTPSNASFQDITWKVIDAGTTGANITKEGKLRATDVGTLILQGTIAKGMTPTEDLVQSFFVSVTPAFIPVTDIEIGNISNIHVDSIVALSANIIPNNATQQYIVWSVRDPGQTGAKISSGNLLSFTGTGTCTITATIEAGLSRASNFTKDFSIVVQPAFIPVTEIDGFPAYSLKGTELSRSKHFDVGDYLIIKQNPGSPNNVTIPDNLIMYCTQAGSTASTKPEGWNSIAEVGNTVQDGSCVFVARDKAAEKDNRKVSPYVSYADGQVGVKLDAIVLPENADNRDIIFEISSMDESGLKPSISNKVLRFDSTVMTHEDQRSITIKMTVKNGLSDGVDYVLESAVYVNPPLAPTAFVPVSGTDWNMLDEPLRAYRPVRLDTTTIQPWDASEKFLTWKITREKEIGGSSCLFFILSDDNKDDLIANGVLFDEVYDWENYKGNILYPMSAGEIKIRLEIPNALGVDQPWVEEKTLTFKDPFIPIKDITNMPTTIYNGTKYYLSPEIDTGDGFDQQTAEWDDRVATHSDIIFDLVDGTNIASIDENGVITPRGTGRIQVRLTVLEGVQEQYKWYEHTFEAINFQKTYEINIVGPEQNTWNKLLTLVKKGSLFGRERINVYTKAEFDLLRSIGDPDDVLPIGGKSVKRSDILEIEFSSKFNLEDLSNFGRNFINLTKINYIPASAKNLRNFLMGCTKFNQTITIPDGITGDRCLEGFLRGCTSFNKPIVIPSSVNGKKCMESFLRDCTSFDHPISVPENIEGDYAMYSFLQGCTSFNSKLTLPKVIHGVRCMENVLRGCTAFDQTITMPEEISGKYNIAAFMFTCNAMAHPVIIPTENFALDAKPDVITFSTFYRGTSLANGLNVYGVGATTFCTNTGDQGSEILVPLRKLLANPEGVAPSDEDDSYYNLHMLASVDANGKYDDFLVADEPKYHITLVNNSNKDINNVRVTGTIPEHLEYREATSLKDTFEDQTESGDFPVPLGDEEATEDEDLNEPTEKRVNFFIGNMRANENVEIIMTTTAAKIANNVTVKFGASYDEMEQQVDKNDSISSVTINIIDIQPEIPDGGEEEE